MAFSLPKLQGPYKTIFHVLAAILVLNWLVAFAKMIYGWKSHSGSMFADGIHSLSDGASNVIGIFGIWMASQPPDKHHPYGHKKYETFAALAIATVLLVICVFLIKDAFTLFYHPHTPEVTPISFAVMIITIAINWGVTVYERRRGKELQSDILLSDALHTQTDLLTSFAVIVSLICVNYGFPMMDSIATLFIAVFIGMAAFGIIKESSDVLCDHMVLDVSEIRKIVLSVDKIRSCHEIRTRGHTLLPDFLGAGRFLSGSLLTTDLFTAVNFPAAPRSTQPRSSFRQKFIQAGVRAKRFARGRAG